jgi:hypothetical protein
MSSRQISTPISSRNIGARYCKSPIADRGQRVMFRRSISIQRSGEANGVKPALA